MGLSYDILKHSFLESLRYYVKAIDVMNNDHELVWKTSLYLDGKLLYIQGVK